VEVYVRLEELLLEEAMLLVSSALPPCPLALVAALLVLSLFLKLPAELLPLE